MEADVRPVFLNLSIILFDLLLQVAVRLHHCLEFFAKNLLATQQATEVVCRGVVSS